MHIRKAFRSAALAGTLGFALIALPGPVAAADKQPVKIEKPEGFKGISQVVIGQFTVAFFVKKIDYDGGGFAAIDGKAKSVGELTGVTPADYQAVTDRIYADFVKQLGNHGITVADDSALKADKYFAKVKDEVPGNRFSIPQKKDDKGDAVAYWPSQLGRNNNIIIPLRIMDGNMVNMYTAEYNYTKSGGGLPVMNVLYVVDFAKPINSDGGGLLQDIKVKAGIALSQFGSQIQLMAPGAKISKITLQTAIAGEGEFAEIKETTSGLTKMANTASVLGGIWKHGIGGISGGGSTMNSRFAYNVTSPQAYSDAAYGVASQGSDLFARAIEGLK